MLATLADAAAPPLAPPGAADAPTLDLYVGEERRTTLAATHSSATEALAAAVLRAGDPGEAVEGRVVLAARIGGETFEFVDPPSSALRPRRRVRNQYVNNACTWVGFCRYPRPFRYQIDGRAIVLSEKDSDFGRADLTMN